MNLRVVNSYAGEAAAAILRQGGSPSNPGILGVTPTVGSNAYVNQSNIRQVTRGATGEAPSIGTMIGRVGGHEAIQHRFLGVPQEAVSGRSPDITTSGVTARELLTSFTTRFNINAGTAGMLRGLCGH